MDGGHIITGGKPRLPGGGGGLPGVLASAGLWLLAMELRHFF